MTKLNRTRVARFALALTLTVCVDSIVPAAWSDQAPGVSPKVGAGNIEYELIVSKDDSVCRYMLGVLRRHTTGHGTNVEDEDTTDKVFKQINWISIDPRVETAFNYSARYARFDINNDGRDELIILEGHDDVRLIAVNSLFIFPTDVSIKTLHRYQDLQKRSIGSVEIKPKGYELRSLQPLPHASWMKGEKEYFPNLTKFILIQPFLYKRKAYLLLSVSPDVRRSPSKVVVARYIDGHVSTANESQMKDICYFNRLER